MNLRFRKKNQMFVNKMQSKIQIVTSRIQMKNEYKYNMTIQSRLKTKCTKRQKLLKEFEIELLLFTRF